MTPTVRRSALAAGLAVAALAFASTGSVAVAADPVISVGPVGSPQGGTAAGTVSSNGQADACLDQQHSSANPSATSPAGVLQIGTSSCAAPAPGSVNGPGSGGGGNSTQSNSTSATNSRSTKASTSTSVTARSTKIRGAAGFSALGSVSAVGASGLRIAQVRYQLLRGNQTKRLRVLVTLQDRKRRLVRFAIVSIGRLAGAKTTLSGIHVGFSNRKGQAAFVVRVTRSMPGKRLLLRIAAHTPHARTLAVGAVVVPKHQRKHAALHHLTYT